MRVVAVILIAASVTLFATVLSGTSMPRADLVIGNGPDPRSLDPAQTSAIADGRILGALFEGLVSFDPADSKPVPGMAESWERSSDGLRLTFHLRKGLAWSDGAPLTAPDLRWSFLRFLDPATAARSVDLLDAVQGARDFNARKGARDAVGIHAPDDVTLVFDLARRSPCFLQALALFPLYPVPRHVVESRGERWSRARPFVSNGAFRLVTWRLRDRVRVERNPRYWDTARTGLRTVDFLSVETATTLLNLFLTKAADIVTDVPPATVPALRERFPAAQGVFAPSPRLGTFFFRINTTVKPFTNARIRSALSLAVDREGIVSAVTRAGEIAARSLVPPGTGTGAAPYEPPLLPASDAAAARRLLEEGLREEGIAALPVFEVLYSPETGDQAIAEVIQDAWSLLGIRCRLVLCDSQTLRSRLVKLDYTVGRSSWIGDFDDPSTFLDQFVSTSAGNRTGWADEEYDALVSRQASEEPDDAARAKLFRAAEERLLRSSPIIPIHHYTSRSLVAPHVTGYKRNILDWHPVRFLGAAAR